MPSWPDIPIPTSAAWIILTSFAPSPRVGRQEGTITMQERLPPSEEGNNLSKADYFKYSVLLCSWSELMRGIKHDIKALVLVSLLSWLHQSTSQHWDRLGGDTATPTPFTSASFCVSAWPNPYAQEHLLQHPISLNSLNRWKIWLQMTM